MTCVLFRNMMDVYIEGRLADSEARRLERHVLSCPACSAELAGWRRLFSELRSIATPPPPEKLKIMLRNAVAVEKHADSAPADGVLDSPFLARELTAAVIFSVAILALSLSISLFTSRAFAGAENHALSNEK